MLTEPKVKFNVTDWQGRDMTTFSGRLMHFFSVAAPYRSFCSSATIRKYNSDVKEIVAKANDKGFVEVTQTKADEFKRNKTVLASSMSPDTEEPIMWPGRVSAFVPTNIPIVAAMLMAVPTP